MKWQKVKNVSHLKNRTRIKYRIHGFVKGIKEKRFIDRDIHNDVISVDEDGYFMTALKGLEVYVLA